jgi:hypothetical protein
VSGLRSRGCDRGGGGQGASATSRGRVVPRGRPGRGAERAPPDCPPRLPPRCSPGRREGGGAASSLASSAAAEAGAATGRRRLRRRRGWRRPARRRGRRRARRRRPRAAPPGSRSPSPRAGRTAEGRLAPVAGAATAGRPWVCVFSPASERLSGVPHRPFRGGLWPQESSGSGPRSLPLARRVETRPIPRYTSAPSPLSLSAHQPADPGPS